MEAALSLSEEVAALFKENQNLLKAPVAKVRFDYRHSAMYSLMTNQQSHFLFPSVHLWEPDSALLRETVLQWEPGLKGESFWIAVHGHQPQELCGGKLQRIQLCHMAYFKPTGVEKDNFERKWQNLYADPDSNNPPPFTGHSDSSPDNSGAWGIRLGALDFLVSGNSNDETGSGP